MIEITNKNECCGCGACVNICPQKCIKMKEDEEGFLYPEVKKDKCVECGACESVCQYKQPVNKMDIMEHPKVYSCVIKNKEQLKNSTTAAVFFNVAKYIIENGGIVYGARYTENMDVIHARADNIEELQYFRGSKYVQSRIGIVYTLVKKDLVDGKKVLFSGTPCQVGGLYKFLKKDYQNLITIDLICYGVPSPKIYRDFVNKYEKKYCSKIVDINYRDKTNGWNNMYTKIVFEDDNIKYFKPSNQNEWYKIFISHISTRQSCNKCLYTSIHRKSDITIGDFWGIEKIDDTINTYDGVSKVLVNTEKGKNLFSSILSEYTIKEKTEKDALRPNLIHPPAIHKKRDKFFLTYQKYGFDKAYNKFVRDSVIKKIKRKIKKIIKGKKNERKF